MLTIPNLVIVKHTLFPIIFLPKPNHLGVIYQSIESSQDYDLSYRVAKLLIAFIKRIIIKRLRSNSLTTNPLKLSLFPTL